ASALAMVAITVTPVNDVPIANAGPDKAVPVGTTVLLDGSASADVDGDVLHYVWVFTSRPSGSSATLTNATSVHPAFFVDRAGTYEISLVANDGQVNSIEDAVAITTINSMPAANAGPDQTVALGATVTLSGAGSSDVDGDPLTYYWSFVSIPQGRAG